MKTSLYYLALVPAIYATPTYYGSDFEYSLLGSDESLNVTEKDFVKPTFHIGDSDDLEELRQDFFLNIVANLTNSLLESADELAEISGKSLEDLVDLPEFNDKKRKRENGNERRKASWQEITGGIINVAGLTLRGMESLWKCVTAEEMTEIASAIESIL